MPYLIYTYMLHCQVVQVWHETCFCNRVHDFHTKIKSHMMVFRCNFLRAEEAVVKTNPIVNLQTQLLADMERFGDLMHRYNQGDASAKEERDQLEGAVEVKLAILEGLKRDEEEYMILDDEDLEVLEDLEEDEDR